MWSVYVAQPWYASETAWAAVGVLASVIIGVVSIFAAYKIANPRRRLAYDLLTCAPLLNAPPDVRSGIELRHCGEVLTAPHFMEIVLTNDGRRDVPTTAFDSGEPIEFDVTASIVTLLRSDSRPDETTSPAVHGTGSKLSIGPGRIARGQRVIVTLLVDGPEPGLVCRHNLIDVQCRRQSLWTGRVMMPVIEMIGVSVGLLAVGAVLAGLDSLHTIRPLAITMMSLGVSGVAAGVGGAVTLILNDQQRRMSRMP